MNIEEKAAQLIQIDVSGPVLSDEEVRHLERLPWNGVLIFARNIVDRDQVVGLIEHIHKLSSVTPMLTVDQEGGLVDRFRFADSVLTPGNMALAATDDVACVRRAHYLMGTQLRQLGIHLDFSPCLDVNNNPDNPIIGVRSFGEDPHKVARFGVAAIEGLREAGVGSCAKHFPGHGDSSMDSHIALPSINHSQERLRNVELVPFQAAVQAGVDSVMTAHITFPAFDPRPGIPATLSHPTLTGLLRGEMGYDGLIFTDSLAMHAIAHNFGLGEATVLSIEAGADIILACGTIEDQETCHKALVEAVRAGRLPESRLDESLARVARFKETHRYLPARGPNASFSSQQEEMKGIVERTITQVRNEGVLPLQGRVLVLTPDLLPLTPLGEMATSQSVTQFLKLPGLEVHEAHYPAVPEGPVLAGLCQQAASFDAVVLAVYARDRLSDGVRRLGEKLLEANPRLVLVSLSSPYLLRDLPGAPACLLSYNYTPLSMQALGRALAGELTPEGKLPVSV